MANVIGPSGSVSQFFVRKAYSRTVWTTAQVKSAFSVPMVVVPITPGFWPVPNYIICNKPAGVAYVANGNTNLSIRSVFSDGTTILTTVLNLTIVSMLAQTVAVSGVARIMTNINMYAIGTNASGIGGYLDAKLDTADMITGDASLEFEILYDLIPAKFGINA